MPQPSQITRRQSDPIVKHQVNLALAHRETFAGAAIIAGQMMLENRLLTEMPALAAKFSVDAENAEPDPTFDEMDFEITGKKERGTLWDWRQAADRVIKFISQGQAADIHAVKVADPPILIFRPQVDNVVISSILSAPASARDGDDGGMGQPVLACFHLLDRIDRRTGVKGQGVRIRE